MRSTPIFLQGKMYHLRYDLNAVWDTDNIVTGGFSSLINKEIDFELCVYLLWSGLKWDIPDLTIQDTEKIINNEIGHFPWIKQKLGIDNTPVLFNIATVCINELFISGWYNKPSDQHTDPDKKPMTTSEIITQMIKGAMYCGYTGDPWRLTPAEINLFITTYNERVENERIDNNFRMGMICATIFNSTRKHATDRVWTWDDFAPGRNHTKEQTAEQMLTIIRSINAAYGGDVK